MAKTSGSTSKKNTAPPSAQNGESGKNGANGDLSSQFTDASMPDSLANGLVPPEPVAETYPIANVEEGAPDVETIISEIPDTSDTTYEPELAKPAAKQDVPTGNKGSKREDENDPALLAAWKCLLDYDRVSTQQKKTYLAIRRTAIVLTVVATAAAVLSGFDLQTRLSFTALALVLVPTLGFMLTNYDELFANSRYRLRDSALWITAIAGFVTVIALIGGAIDRAQGSWALWRALVVLPFVIWLGALLYNHVYARSRPAAEASQDKKPNYNLGVVRLWMALAGAGFIITMLIVVLSDYQMDALAWILRVLLIIIPIISVGLLNYAAEYARNTAWLEYRVGAEEIRSQIYRYRAHAGKYAVAEKQKKREKLLRAVEKTYRDISNSDFVPFMSPPDNDKLKTAIQLHCDKSPGTSNKDNGLSDLNAEQYLNWRAKKQIEWYVGKIERDYILKRRSTVGALVLAGMGSALVALSEPFAPVVALTTACGVALTLWTNASTIGATYGIFQKAASDLQIRLNRWESQPTEIQENPQEGAALVESMEGIFKEEREEWEMAVRHMLQSVDKALQDIQRQSDDDDDDPPPEPPVDELTDVEEVVAEAEAAQLPFDEAAEGEAESETSGEEITPPGTKG
jgi:hypothetical protein